jgi:hypothetical protein
MPANYLKITARRLLLARTLTGYQIIPAALANPAVNLPTGIEYI